jgi:hypothetical protein
MSNLTGRELDFLASLRFSWTHLYWNEVMRLLREDDPCDAPPEAHFTVLPCRPWNGYTPN